MFALRTLTTAFAVLALANSAVHGLTSLHDENKNGFVPENVFENVEVINTIDVTGPFAKMSSAMRIKNIGSESQSVYYFAIPLEEEPKIALVDSQDMTNKLPITIEPSAEWNQEHGASFYKFHLPKPVEPGQEVEVVVARAVTGLLSPMPSVARQDESQYMLLKHSRIPYSAYQTKASKLRVRTHGLFLEDLTGSDENKGTVDGAVLTLGPYRDVKPLSTEDLWLRFESPVPLAKITKLQRDVWISHWGDSVSFEETYWLHNIGTKPDHFSRLEYQRVAQSYNLNHAAVRGLEIPLTPGARDLYYTDLVGNVSLSNFRPGDDVLEVRPRYPVMGGWNYNFTIGWTSDASAFIKKVRLAASKDEGESAVLDDVYLGKIPLLNGPAGMHYDDVNLRIILPEGSSEIDVLSMVGTNSSVVETNSFLDTKGRPTVVLSYKNLIDGHRNGDLYIRYRYSTSDALVKPLALSAKFLVLFVAVIAIGKLDISIRRKPKSS